MYHGSFFSKEITLQIQFLTSFLCLRENMMPSEKNCILQLTLNNLYFRFLLYKILIKKALPVQRSFMVNARNIKRDLNLVALRIK